MCNIRIIYFRTCSFPYSAIYNFVVENNFLSLIAPILLIYFGWVSMSVRITIKEKKTLTLEKSGF